MLFRTYSYASLMGPIQKLKIPLHKNNEIFQWDLHSWERTGVSE